MVGNSKLVARIDPRGVPRFFVRIKYLLVALAALQAVATLQGVIAHYQVATEVAAYKASVAEATRKINEAFKQP